MHPRWIGGFAATLIATAIPLLAQSPVPARVPRIRPLQAEGAAALEAGMKHSATFRALVAELERSDVAVYIYVTPNLSRYVGGGLGFVGASATMRFLKVVLRFDLSPTEMVWVLGHELQHAAEIARAPAVRSEAAFHRFYVHVGMRGAVEHTFETADARDIGQRVRRELFESMKVVDPGQSPR